MANSFYWYDDMGDIKASLGNWAPWERTALDYATNYTTSLMLAAPFAAAAIVEQTHANVNLSLAIRPSGG
jgi:hypothetical protein